ncbi:MAG: DNA gyrase subunit A [Proteobacteria bacterium]|nr:MAG: DNA gyrase subunit A [Pseudomonadota bacterium]
MAEFIEQKGVERVSIVDEMKASYMEYAMSVIVSRALPDVRDGLKPVHRRILYAQQELSNYWNRSYKKSARIVGDVMGKYHPHGDQAIYDTLVRMAQDFSMRLPLEDGQGNFGSMDGDKAAAMRYTEIRMAKSAHAMLSDIEKDTVDFVPNYDGNDQEPTVLPTRFPNLLINGTAGIAVGIATNIPPHNLNEVVDATIHLVDNPTASDETLGEYIQGPDFPTGGICLGLAGIKTAIAGGRGSVVVRAKTHFESDEKSGKQSIIVDEMPYQVNKANMIKRIAELVQEKVIEGISDLRDESDRDGVRVVVELRRDANAEVVLSQLLKHTPMQTSFGYNMLAIHNGRPKLMGMRQVLNAFVDHREEVIRRRTRYDLNKARARAHILVGLATAVANIDEIIHIIRHAANPAEAKAQLMDKAWAAADVLPLMELLGEPVGENNTCVMSEIQAQAILDLRLHRLTGLERDKIQDEANEIAAIIRDLVEILSNRAKLLAILKEELLEVKEQFGTPRRTEIMEGSAEVDMEDLIKPEEMVVTISSDGYVKRQPMDDYRAQRRGGKGRSAANMKEDEQIQDFFIANTHSPLFFFTTTGKVHRLKVYNLPIASSGARGKAFVNLLPLEKDEKVMRVVRIPRNQEEWEGQVLMFATEQGLIRKTPLTAFNNVHKNGIKGISLNEGDALINVALADENSGDIIMNSANGQAVRFSNESLRTIASRTAYGVKGMTLKDGDKIVSADIIKGDELPYILTVTENGFGKRTVCEDFPAKSRGTMGVIAIKTSERNGKVIASLPVGEGDHVMIATSDGQVIRMATDDISVIGRNTQGVTLFKTDGAKVYSVARIPADTMVEEEFEADMIVDEHGNPVEATSEDVVAAEASTDTETEQTEGENIN